MGLARTCSLPLIVSLFSLSMNDLRIKRSAILSLEKCCLYLNDVDDKSNPMTELEARAFEDYLHKINEALVRRGPVTFEIFKDMVSKPLIWERYCPPVRRRKVGNQARVKPHTWERYCQPVRRRKDGNQARGSSTWEYSLYVCENIFPNPSLLFCYFTPLSRDLCSFKWYDYSDIEDPDRYRTMYKRTECWFKIRNWLATLNRDSMTLPGDRPGTDLYKILEWWRNFVPTQPYPRILLYPHQCTTFACPAQSKLQPSRLSSIIEEPHTLVADGIPQVGPARKPVPTPPSPPPCECSICKRPLHEDGMDSTPQPWIEGTPLEDRNKADPVHLKLESIENAVLAAPAGRLLSVVSMEVGSAAKDCAFVEGDDTIETCSDRGFGHKAVAKETRAKRSFSSFASDEDQSLEDAESLQPPRKNQKMTYDLEYSASDTDSMMTEVEYGPPDSSYDMSTDEDYWSAKSTAELSLLSLD